jgi:protein CpxP
MNTMLRSTLMLVLLALPLAAQSGPDPSPRAERIGRRLQLTEAQKASIRTIRDKHRADLVQRRDAVQHAWIDLRSALQDTSTPEPRLRALYDRASAARFDLILARRSARMEVQAVLTPEQRAKAAEMRDRARRRFAGEWARG